MSLIGMSQKRQLRGKCLMAATAGEVHLGAAKGNCWSGLNRVRGAGVEGNDGEKAAAVQGEALRIFTVA